MHILLLGINHKTAPVELREKLYLGEDDVRAVSMKLVGDGSPARECVILSTCNRTELYALSDGLKDGYARLTEFVAELSGASTTDLRNNLYRMSNMEAVRHLFYVAAGLDSMIVGEGQILGQVRTAFQLAQETGVAKKTLNSLFRQAVRVGKRSRSETGIARSAVSVSSAAVSLAAQLFGELSQKNILLIGAGKMIELTVRHLVSAGARRFIVVNRTFGRAQALAEKLDGAEAMPFERLDDALCRADIVISSTGAMKYVVFKEDMKAIMKKRRHRIIFFVDIAVPRDIEPSVNDIERCFVYDIDDLKNVVDENMEARRGEIVEVEKIIEEEVESFRKWYSSLNVAPTLVSFRGAIEQIRQSEMDRFSAKLEKMPEDQRKLVEQITASMINKIMHQPTKTLKEADQRQDGSFYAQALKNLFGLEVEDKRLENETESKGDDE